VTDPWARPANQAPPVPPRPQFPQGPNPGQAGVPPQGRPGEPQKTDSSLLAKIKNLFRDPLSIVLVVVIVVALVLVGVLGGELYARSRADSVITKATECVVQDSAKASFGVVPPFLWQHMSGHYTNINIETAGNQVRQAKGMKVIINIKDVRLQDTANASGSIGSLVANINWSSEGIKQTIQDAIPLVGAFLTGVTTDPSAGTIELQGALGKITAKPEVVDNGISLQVTELSGLGFTLPRETVQPALDAFTSTLTKNYPLGIHADNVQVTDSGVVSQFSTQNASIPKDNQDPCFAGL
jgi:LmeA-like phospholipid-binding